MAISDGGRPSNADPGRGKHARPEPHDLDDGDPLRGRHVAVTARFTEHACRLIVAGCYDSASDWHYGPVDLGDERPSVRLVDRSRR